MVHKRTDKEIKKIAASCQIVADTLIMLRPYVLEGARISDLDNLAESFIISRGARPAFKGYMGFPSTLCVSVDSAVVHGVPNDDILREGQIVSVDCGAELDGYYGDHAISFPVGKVNANKQKLLDVTKQSLLKGIEQAVPGNYVGDIGNAVQTHAESNGFSVVRELVGHGIGTNLHEDPQIPNFGIPNKGHMLHAGMCIAIEPMINAGTKDILTSKDGWTIITKDGAPSAHFEHTVAITENGPEILSVGSDA